MSYIEKVLSHIKGKENLKKIEYELSDHIDEHKAFFEEIGYDEENALSKAEEKMGDADLVGEQFSAIMKSEKRRKIISLVLLGLLAVGVVAFYLIASQYYRDSMMHLSWMAPRYYMLLPYYWGVVIHTVLMLFALALMLYGNKRKSILHIVFSYLSGAFLVIGGPYYWVEIFDFRHYIYSFYTTHDIYFNFVNAEPPTRIASAIAVSVLTVLFALSLNNAIKTKKLRNTKKDLKINKAVRVVIIAVAMFFVAVTATTTIGIASFREEVISTHPSDLKKANEFAVEGGVKLLSGNYDEAVSILKNKFENVEVNGENEAYKFFDSGVYIHMWNSSYDEDPPSLSVNSEIYNPFRITKNILVVTDTPKLESVKTPYELPVCPCVDVEQYDDDSMHLVFNYDGTDNRIVDFVYDEEADSLGDENRDCLKLYATSMLDFESKATLSEKQLMLLEKYSGNYCDYMVQDYESYSNTILLDDYAFKSEKASRFYKDNRGLSSDMITVFSVKYNEKMDTYWIRLGSTLYEYPFMSGGLYPHISYNNIVCFDVVVKFTDSDLKVYSTHHSGGTEHWKADEGAKEYADFIASDIKELLIKDINKKLENGEEFYF